MQALGMYMGKSPENFFPEIKDKKKKTLNTFIPSKMHKISAHCINSTDPQSFNWMRPFLHSQREATAHYDHSYALSVIAKWEKSVGHGVKIIVWCTSITLTPNLKNPGFNQLKREKRRISNALVTLHWITSLVHLTTTFFCFFNYSLFHRSWPIVFFCFCFFIIFFVVCF